jgi:hypothetical protein
MCSMCKSLGCSCSSCIVHKPYKPRQIIISDTHIMCPECGTKWEFEDSCYMIDDYGYESYRFFEDMKQEEADVKG